MTTPTNPDAEASLTVALAAAMEHVREQQCRDSLQPTSLTVALLAEYLIGQGWPATRPTLAPEGQTTTEWAVFVDSQDPNGEQARFVHYPTQARARANLFAHDLSGGGGIASCTVTRGPWQVVTTEGDEQS